MNPSQQLIAYYQALLIAEFQLPKAIATIGALAGGSDGAHGLIANADGERISLYQAYDETDEANFIARKIQELLDKGALMPRREAGGAKLQDCTVLYRANFQSRAIEEALLAAGIAYQVVGTRFFERKEVKDTLSFVRAALVGGAADCLGS